jgi:GNAT superfamily N-acetyltransferase
VTVELHFAQYNVATLREPLDHPDSAAFVDGLGPVNALAETTPGYVWRLQSDEGDATSIAAYPDPRTIVNLTVWENEAALREFAFRGLHRDFLRRRGDWFLPGESKAANWWIPAGTVPTVEQAKRRVAFLDRFGPSAYAFTHGTSFGQLVIVPRDLHHPDVRPVLDRLDHELITTEPDGGICFITLDPDDVAPGDGAFFLAYLDGVPRACGAYRRIGPHTAEVKRMWADPDLRGAKLGAAVLDTVEAAAIADGFTELKLETGEHLTAAVALYRKFGFEQCEPWGDYIDAPHSLCMSKTLVAG